jgi:Arc/MetJ-type ribon-helix-helix transcriptional regulator
MAFFAIECHLSHFSTPQEAHKMQSMNVSLTEPLKQFVDSQISTGRYSSASEYVRELIRNDEKRNAEEHL